MHRYFCSSHPRYYRDAIDPSMRCHTGASPVALPDALCAAHRPHNRPASDRHPRDIDGSKRTAGRLAGDALREDRHPVHGRCRDRSPARHGVGQSPLPVASASRHCRHHRDALAHHRSRDGSDLPALPSRGDACAGTAQHARLRDARAAPASEGSGGVASGAAGRGPESPHGELEPRPVAGGAHPRAAASDCRGGRHVHRHHFGQRPVPFPQSPAVCHAVLPVACGVAAAGSLA